MKEKNNTIIFSRIVILSGSPGAGKSTLSQRLAENASGDKAVHIELDDFWQYIRKGYVQPWLDGSGGQNETVVDAAAASAECYARGGYEVFVAGTIGPWFLKPWLELAGKGFDVRYVVLRPDEESTVYRATQREQRDFFPLNVEVLKDLWQSFSGLGEYEAHTVNTSGQTVEASTALIGKLLLAGKFRVL